MTATLPPSLSRHPLVSLAMGADLNGASGATSCDGETTAVTRERRHGVFTRRHPLASLAMGADLNGASSITMDGHFISQVVI